MRRYDRQALASYWPRRGRCRSNCLYSCRMEWKSRIWNYLQYWFVRLLSFKKKRLKNFNYNFFNFNIIYRRAFSFWKCWSHTWWCHQHNRISKKSWSLLSINHNKIRSHDLCNYWWLHEQSMSEWSFLFRWTKYFCLRLFARQVKTNTLRLSWLFFINLTLFVVRKMIWNS